jgi:hypothetical protein
MRQQTSHSACSCDVVSSSIATVLVKHNPRYERLNVLFCSQTGHCSSKNMMRLRHNSVTLFQLVYEAGSSFIRLPLDELPFLGNDINHNNNDGHVQSSSFLGGVVERRSNADLLVWSQLRHCAFMRNPIKPHMVFSISPPSTGLLHHPHPHGSITIVPWAF